MPAEPVTTLVGLTESFVQTLGAGLSECRGDSSNLGSSNKCLPKRLKGRVVRPIPPSHHATSPSETGSQDPFSAAGDQVVSYTHPTPQIERHLNDPK